MLRATLLKLSESPRFAQWVTSNGTTRRMARRFVAGETLDEAIEAARACNNLGMLASLDYLGESCSTTADAQRARDAYLEIFERIHKENLHANVSCKLTQLGLDLNVDFCQGLVVSIVELAARYENFLRVDMEGSAYTQRTLDIVKRVRARNPAIGTVIQAYLFRSETDVQDLLGYGCRIRLCKGAYKELPDVAYPGKKDVDFNFIRWAATRQISKDDFEFQMLYGVRTDLQRMLVKDGYRLRIYIPYGNDWFPYFMRRLAERPANLGFFIRSFLHS